ncbi:MAG: hypothetical protein LBT88_06000 [Oscillospiraceae bacterium]|jgi:hypothetical protein|nr:hypothetical protein [Oscillospiraceae bacterium]
MSIQDLKDLLNKNNIKPSAYCLPPDDYSVCDCVYYLQPAKDGRWAVFFEERGKRSDMTYHATEDEACRRFKEIFYPKLAE